MDMSMVRVLVAAAFVAAVVGAGLVTPADAAKCAKIGGEGTGVGEPLAKDQATMALGEAIKAYGGKASGKAAYKCTSTALVVYSCTATQRACK
jgi:thiazole synthase ThiGH ThiG subunit